METMNEALERICTPQFYDNCEQDMKLVMEEFKSARSNGIPVDSLLIESIAEKRYEQASDYSLSEGAPGATLESSRSIVNTLMSMELQMEFAQEAGKTITTNFFHKL